MMTLKTLFHMDVKWGSRPFDRAQGRDEIHVYKNAVKRELNCRWSSLAIDLTKDTVIGRDKGLHVFMCEDWYVFSIDSLD